MADKKYFALFHLKMVDAMSSNTHIGVDLELSCFIVNIQLKYFFLSEIKFTGVVLLRGPFNGTNGVFIFFGF